MNLRKIVLTALVLTLPLQVAADDFAAERETMIAEQLEGRGIRSASVLRAMRKVPRHEFVPPALRHEAYADRPLPIGYDQTISQPYIVALMTQLLELKGNEKVLEIGTGSGYQAAVLAELTKAVYSIEIVEPLGRRAQEVLKRLGYRNVRVRIGDGYKGWPEHAPFDAVIVTCSPEDVPPALVEQLREGGTIVIPVGRWPDQTLYRLKKRGRSLEREAITPVSFVPMVRSGE
jgi:protein-L-isoaspartate(D-aspartate) O-methyltransferase